MYTPWLMMLLCYFFNEIFQILLWAQKGNLSGRRNRYAKVYESQPFLFLTSHITCKSIRRLGNKKCSWHNCLLTLYTRLPTRRVVALKPLYINHWAQSSNPARKASWDEIQLGLIYFCCAAYIWIIYNMLILIHFKQYKYLTWLNIDTICWRIQISQ